MLLLAAISAAAASPPPVRVEAQARVSITILQPHLASPKTWDPKARPNQREIVKREHDGTQVRIRLTEYE